MTANPSSILSTAEIWRGFGLALALGMLLGLVIALVNGWGPR